MAVTIKEIAKDLGLSAVTISKVLRNHEDISKKTRDLVLKRAKELGYRPNLTARSLVTGKSSLVGLVVPDLLHPFFAEVAKALAARLRQQGLYLLICSSEGDAELERNQIEHLLSRGLDAIVVAPVGDDEEALRAVVASRTLLVLIDRRRQVDHTHFIGSDDVTVGMLATEHLIAMGCKRIAHLRGPNNSVGAARMQGYREALQKADIPFRPKLVTVASSGDVVSRKQGAEFLESLIMGKAAPDGIFCYSDPMAIGAMQRAIKLGIRIPQDLAIVGCGNLHYDDVLAIPLSTIDQRSAEIGERSATLILEKTTRGKYEDIPDRSEETYLNLCLPPALIVRASSNRSAK